jgi:hypothetical protein
LPRLPRFTTAFLTSRSALVAREGRAGSRDVALALHAIVEARELPEDDDVLTALPSRLPDRYVLCHVRRVAKRNLWIWYQATESDVEFVDMTDQPPRSTRP